MGESSSKTRKFLNTFEGTFLRTTDSSCLESYKKPNVCQNGFSILTLLKHP